VLTVVTVPEEIVVATAVPPETPSNNNARLEEILTGANWFSVTAVVAVSSLCPTKPVAIIPVPVESNPAVITTSFDHGYSSGTIIKIKIPFVCGMEGIDGYSGVITVTGTDTFTVDVDSTNFNAFAIPAAPVPVWADTCAQVIPIGEVNDMITGATRNVRT